MMEAPPCTPVLLTVCSAMLTSVRTCMPTLSCPEAPPCTPVLLTVCRRRSLPLLHPPSRSRSLLHQRGNTLSGSEDPSLPPSPPSSRCGSPSRNMMSAAHPLSTASASKSFSTLTLKISFRFSSLTFHSKFYQPNIFFHYFKINIR